MATFRGSRLSIRRVGPVETRGTEGIRWCFRFRVLLERHCFAGRESLTDARYLGGDDRHNGR